MTDDTSLNRRQFIQRSLGGAAAAVVGTHLVGCDKSSESADKSADKSSAAAASSGSTKRRFAGQQLRIFIYAGAWEKVFREVFIPKFQAQTGAEVVLEPGWWDAIPKLKASPKGQPAYDLVLTDATQGYPAIREGLFQTLDFDRIPNLEKHSPAVLDNWVYDDGYGVPYPDSVMTLAYRKDSVQSPPTGWEALLDDAYDHNLGMYDSFYMSLYTFAAMKVAAEGRPGQAHAELADNLSGVLDFAKRNRDRVTYWWPTSSDMTFALSHDNCQIGNMHSVDMMPVLKNSDKLEAVVPDKDRAFVQLMWVVPADTQKKALAETAINMISGETMQTALARRGSTTPILSVAQKVAADHPRWASIYPTSKKQMNAIKYYPYDAYFDDWDHIVDYWDKQVLRKG